jgi:uncharacterized protein YqfB (UPF0267 family)
MTSEYDGTYITVASVRRTVGIDSNEISDIDVGATITEIEAQVPRMFNTHFVPTEKIEFLDGEGTNRLHLEQNPILSVRDLRIDGTTEDPANLEIDKESGYIFLGQDASIGKFAAKRNAIVVKYIYGTVEHSTTETTSSDAEVAGTSVSVAVASETDFTALDWVEIFGMDGKREVAQVSSTSTGVLVLDKLVQAHEAGSTITKLQVNINFTKFMNLVASIAMVARIIGQSYDENTGYSLGELSIQKGEPYTQWRETANQFIKERDLLLSRISIRPYII